MSFASINNVGIRGLTTVVPDNKVFFEDDASRLGMSESFARRIRDSVGLNQRFVVKNGVTSLDLAEKATLSLLNGMEMSVQEIGFLVFVTQTPDHAQPCNAALLHGRLKMNEQCGCMDINLGCSGFVYGLYVASLIHASLGKSVLLIAGDTLSKAVNPKDKATSILFGDAASACLVGAKQEETMFFELNTDGGGSQSIIVPAGGARLPKNIETGKEFLDDDGNTRSLNDLKMEGAEVFNFAVRTEPRAIKSILEYANIPPEKIARFYLHQANKYILTTIRKRLKVEASKVPDAVISKYGNQSSASIPCAINEDSNKSLPALVVLSGFGVGLSWASVVCNLDIDFCPQPIIWSV